MSDAEEFRIVPAYAEDGSETGYYTREPDGVSGMSVTALARFCGVKQQTVTQLLNRIEDCDPITNDLPEQLKPFAGKDLRLITNDTQGIKIVPDDICYAIAEYYAFDARSYEGQKVAQDNYRMAGRAGIRVFIWSQTGYIPDLLRDSLRSNTTAYIKRLENMRDHDVPDDLWTTFREGAEVLLLVEKEMGVPVDQMDLCDGSIGRRWMIYREGKPWVEEIGSYIHSFRDKRPDASCHAFQLSELSYFRKWLREAYIPHHLPKYLTEKFGKKAALEIYQDIGGVTDRVIEVTKITRMTSAQQKLYEEFKRIRQRLLKAPIEEEQLKLPEDTE